MSAQRQERDASTVSGYRTLARDVILGIVAVIFVSLAVPAWIIQAEYRKTSDPPMKPVPVAEVLRERTSETVIPRRAPDILKVAERLVQREAEEREAKRRARAHSSITHLTDVSVPSAATVQAGAVTPVANTPQVDLRQSAQAP
jgi:hypothetical protein